MIRTRCFEILQVGGGSSPENADSASLSIVIISLYCFADKEVVDKSNCYLNLVDYLACLILTFI